MRFYTHFEEIRRNTQAKTPAGTKMRLNQEVARAHVWQKAY